MSLEPVDETAELGDDAFAIKGGKGAAKHDRDFTSRGGKGKKDNEKGGGKGSTDAPLAIAIPDGQPYLLGDEQLGTDVLAATSGGTAPFECWIYPGNGRGTVPLGVSQDFDADPSGCTVSGAMFGAPGNYGFFVEVVDATGAAVDVPVLYQGPPCDTAGVTMLPSADSVTVGAAGAGHTFQIDITDVDAVAEDGICDSCITTAVQTRAPLQTAPRLDCNEPGEVCSDGELTMHGACPGPNAATATRFVSVDAHEPVRGDQPGWVTVDMTVNYSGAQLSPCGGKQWACHVEILEMP